MTGRLTKLGIVLAIFGLGFIVVSGYAFVKVQEGQRSLQAFNAAQNVKLTYNEEGQLVDRGDVAEGQAIMSLLTNDWGYAITPGELNPNDPIVNTASEYMYEMATVSYHTLHGTQTVILDEDFTAPDGTVYTAGVPYEVPVDGRYYSELDRNNPIEAAIRNQAWSPLALSLIGELGVGTATASSLQMGLGVAAIAFGLGFTFIFMGAGLVWAVRPETAKVRATQQSLAPTPA